MSKFNGNNEKKSLNCVKYDHLTGLRAPDEGDSAEINWSVNLYVLPTLAEARTHRPHFDINGGEVYGLELAPGMPFTAEVQLNSRLRV